MDRDVNELELNQRKAYYLKHLNNKDYERDQDQEEGKRINTIRWDLDSNREILKKWLKKLMREIDINAQQKTGSDKKR